MRRFAFAAFIATALAGPAFAQQMSAQDFVNMAASSDMFEIQSSQLAVEQGQTDNVKEFAQMMITDHTASSQKLATIAAAQNLTVPAEMMAPQTELMENVTGAEGDAFDAAYGQAQAENHMVAAQLLETYSENGDNEALKEFAAETLPVVQQHLETAKTLPGAENATTTQ
jgi:putative membrane protein